jgi:hypothetical protein
MTYNEKLNLVQTCAETKQFLGIIFWKAGRTTGKNALAILLCMASFFHQPHPSHLPFPSPHPREVFIFIFILSVTAGKKKKLGGCII